MQISIIIPNYNGKQLLSANLPQILKYASSAEIVVVDDGSTDGSVIFLKHNFREIKVLEIANNRGFATAVNLGVKAAQSEIIVLLNSDVSPLTEFLPKIVTHFQDPLVFAVGFMDKSQEEKVVKRGRGVGRFMRGLFVHSRGEVNKTTSLWANGGSSAFRKIPWEKLGGFDDLYHPFYWEDIDLSYRALKSGYKIIFDPRIQVSHTHQLGSIKTHYKHAFIQTIAYRNQFIFIWKNITYTPFFIQHLIWLPYHLLIAMVKGNSRLLKGFLLALAKIPEIYRKRQYQKHFNKVSDDFVLAQFTDEYV